MLAILVIIALVGFIAWGIIDGMKVEYKAGTWMELKDQNEINDDDLYIRLMTDVTRSTLRNILPLIRYAYFEPNGEVNTQVFLSIGAYKPMLNSDKLERAYLKKVKQQDEESKTKQTNRREKALASFLE